LAYCSGDKVAIRSLRNILCLTCLWFHSHEEVGNKEKGLFSLRNAGNCSPKHAATRHKRLACSVTPLWEPQMLHFLYYWLNEYTGIKSNFLCGIIRLIECELASKWIYQFEFYWLLNKYANSNYAVDCMRMPVCIVVVTVWICHCELHHVTKSDNVNFIYWYINMPARIKLMCIRTNINYAFSEGINMP